LVLAKAQASGNQCIVVWPDRAVVIRHRVVARLEIGHGAYTPAREKNIVMQALDDGGRVLRPGDVREQAMTGIRAAYAALILLTVQRQCVHRDLRAPEALLKALPDAPGGVGERART